MIIITGSEGKLSVKFPKSGLFSQELWFCVVVSKTKNPNLGICSKRPGLATGKSGTHEWLIVDFREVEALKSSLYTRQWALKSVNMAYTGLF